MNAETVTISAAKAVILAQLIESVCESEHGAAYAVGIGASRAQLHLLAEELRHPRIFTHHAAVPAGQR